MITLSQQDRKLLYEQLEEAIEDGYRREKDVLAQYGFSKLDEYDIRVICKMKIVN